jgi:hypothetical protein
MPALNSFPLRGLSVSLRVAVWLALFLSPTGYFLLLMIVDKSQVPAPPDNIVVLLFCLVPVVALVGCEAAVGLSKLGLGWRVAWLVLTVLAMLIQVGILLVIIVSAVTVAIAPAQ